MTNPDKCEEEMKSEKLFQRSEERPEESLTRSAWHDDVDDSSSESQSNSSDYKEQDDEDDNDGNFSDNDGDYCFEDEIQRELDAHIQKELDLALDRQLDEMMLENQRRLEEQFEREIEEQWDEQLKEYGQQAATTMNSMFGLMGLDEGDNSNLESATANRTKDTAEATTTVKEVNAQIDRVVQQFRSAHPMG